MRRTKALEQAEQMREDFEAARAALKGQKPVFTLLSATFAEELIRDIRAERDLECSDFDRSSVQELEIVFPEDLPEP